MTEHTQPDGPTPSGISLVMSRRGLLTAGTAVASAVAVGAVPTAAAAAPSTNGVIYGVEDDKDLLWYRHEGRSNGTPRWANNGTGRKVGSGWDFAHVFAGGAGVLYGVEHDGDLLWYRHDGAADGTARWANRGRGRKVGSGWDFTHVFSGGAGVLYAVQGNGDLFWYRHEGRSNGTPRWANNGTGRRIGNGWNFEHVLYGN